MVPYSHGELRQLEEAGRNAEHCVCCGAIIPEGRQICPNCERGADANSSDRSADIKGQNLYMFYDHISNERHFVRGKTIHDALEREYGEERARFIFKNFKWKRVY